MVAGHLVAFAAAGQAWADEGGASAYVPGQFASFAAAPDDPGFSLETIYYHRYAAATASRAFPIDGRIDFGLTVVEDWLFLTPGYTFANAVLGGHLYLGVSFAPGGLSTSITATLTGPAGNSASAGESDAITGFGDIFPSAELKWNMGRHNVMAYLGVNVPVGQYDPNRIAALGIGHWAIDGGLGYTFMSGTGIEASLTVGATKNFMNPYTQYLSGTDGHLDWGLSYSPNDNFYFGAAGYVYRQLEPDSGPDAALLGGFQSRVSAVGPQLGYSFSTGPVAFEIDLRGYKEFDALNRPEGWNIWFTVTLSRSRHGHALK
jgi:hypothetical protein